jgi:hypothetical protein
MKRLLIISSFALTGLFAVVAAAPASSKPDTHVLIVSGLLIDYEENMFRDLSLNSLRNYFLQTARLNKGNVTVLVDENSAARLPADPCSTASQLFAVAAELSNRVKADDRFIFYYLGQANIVQDTLRLNLPGKDITHEQLADALRPIRGASRLIILDCPGAGLAIRSFAGENNIVIAGARSDQPYGTRFSPYFIPALADPNSDTNTDGRVSLLEAFTAVCKQLDEFYSSQDLVKIENAILEDDGDGVGSQRPWKYEEELHDGAVADKYFLSDYKVRKEVPDEQ